MRILKEKVSTILLEESKAIKNQIELLNYNDLQAVINQLDQCEGKIITTGCGTSGVVSKKVAHTLSCIGLSTVYLCPSDAVHGSLGIINEKDVVVIFSKGGNTKELLPLLTPFKEKGSCIIGVGENQDSKIGSFCNYFLKIYTETEPDPFNMLAMSSIISVISIFDAITIELMRKRHFTKESLLLNHPSGAVGEKLALQVERN